MSLTDSILRTHKRPFRLALIFSIPLVALLCIVLSALALWDKRNIKQNFELQLLEAARAYYQQVLITRKWNSIHGGVYVETTHETPPNPYLDDSERDIISTGGKKFTKLNPAYMTRQISKLAQEEGAYVFHMTSLNPLNPDNRPDQWERNFLLAFESGKKEGYGMSFLDGKEYFRFIAPLRADAECLECHGRQGYEAGDIRGALSVSIPADGLAKAFEAMQSRSITVFGLIGMITASLVFGMSRAFSGRLTEDLRKEIEGERLRTAIRLAGATAHELRQPMTIISGFAEIIKDKSENGQEVSPEVALISDQCDRMNGIITRMLNITSYKTKDYGENAEIFDFEAGSEVEGSEDSKGSNFPVDSA